jgi:hypothetical protein
MTFDPPSQETVAEEETSAVEPAVTARLLISLAHDWALRRVHETSPSGVRELKEMVDVVWKGLRPH